MLIHILSDLHLEFGRFTFPATNADVVVLAGDISVGMGHRDTVTQWCHDNPRKIFLMIAGNHEFYQQDMDEELCKLIAWAEQVPNLYFLENNTEVLVTGSNYSQQVRFVGCTLWTDMKNYDTLVMQAVKEGMNDFRLIRRDGVTFTPAMAADKHYMSRRWLEQVLAQEFDGPTVVVTHHAPSYKSTRYGGSLLDCGFASNLDDLILDFAPQLWIHGHMHDSLDYKIGETRIICNPRGYVGHKINYYFDPSLVVEV